MTAMLEQLIAIVGRQSDFDEKEDADSSLFISAQLTVLMAELLTKLLKIRNYDDARYYIEQMCSEVGREDKQRLVESFILVLKEGDPMNFVAIKCLRWLCLDRDTRRTLLQRSQFTSVIIAIAFSQADNTSGLGLYLVFDILSYLCIEEAVTMREQLIYARVGRLADRITRNCEDLTKEPKWLLEFIKIIVQTIEITEKGRVSMKHTLTLPMFK